MRVLASSWLVVAISSTLVAGCESRRTLVTSPEIGGPLAAVTSKPDVAAPTNAAATAVSDTRIDLSWHDNSDNEASFDIHRSISGASGPFTLYQSKSANATTFSDQSLQAATQYCYEVRAVRTVGNRVVYSAFSNVACATTLPPPPQQVCCTWAVPLDSTTVQVRWRDQSYNEDGFRVERSTDVINWTVVGTAKTESLVDAGVANAELGVCYRVVAFNSTGDATPVGPACTNRPAAPTIVGFVQVDSQTFDISWRDNSAIEDSYQIWAEIAWAPDCTGACDAVIYYFDWLVAELPANSTSYRCTTCAGASVWVVARKGDVTSY